jgi:hypothetical protein
MPYFSRYDGFQLFRHFLGSPAKERINCLPRVSLPPHSPKGYARREYGGKTGLQKINPDTLFLSGKKVPEQFKSLKTREKRHFSRV